ncbi:MAG: hypothetical protein JWR74_1823 [Polaromonas sp.]|nr:hypothetical protein [Polaromonas sp.]
MLTFIQSRLARRAHPAGQGKNTACFAFVALLAISAATAQIASAQIAAGTTGIDATGNARSEMAACHNGTTQQARETCMTEVRNANGEKRAGSLTGGSDFSANALKRCDVFPEASDQAACRARIMGESEAKGGVAAGGVIRETETVVSPSSEGAVPVKP